MGGKPVSRISGERCTLGKRLTVLALTESRARGFTRFKAASERKDKTPFVIRISRIFAYGFALVFFVAQASAQEQAEDPPLEPPDLLSIELNTPQSGEIEHGHQGETSWPVERDPLEGLLKEELGATSASPTISQPQASNPALEDLKSLLREIDPRENISIQLSPESGDKRPSSGTNTRSESDANPPPRRDLADPAGEASYGGRSNTTITIGEIGDTVLDLLSDYRIYTYLLLSFGAILAVFVLVVLLRRQNERRKRRLASRRGRRRSSGRRRRFAHP